MKINRDNCEAWFLDYHEGNLSDAQVAELFAFLEAHPDLRESFEAFNDFTFDADKNNSVPDFSYLKKETKSVSEEQAEQWMVDAVEGVISDDDRILLDEYLKVHPKKKQDLELIAKTKITPDHNETFSGKSALKKNVPVTADNFDDYAVAVIEGTISPEEKARLDLFIAANPEFKKQLDLYGNTLLDATEVIRFDDKDTLRRREPVLSEHNIDEYLAAQAEGLLNAQDESAVMKFIAQHPQYKNEAELFRKTILVPETQITFENKHELKRTALVVNESNFEEKLIAANENLLNNEEEAALKLFIVGNTERQKTAALYAQTKVQPDLSVVFEDKESLKRKKGGAFFRIKYMQFAAAAVLVLLLGIYFWTKYQSGTGEIPVNVVADKNQVKQKEEVKTVPDESLVPEQKDTALLADRNGSDTESKHTQIVTVPTVDRNTNEQMVFIPSRNAQYTLENHGNDAVNFSESFYSAEDVRTPDKKNEYVSVTQYAMRWMKNKIEGDDQLKNDEQAVSATLADGRTGNNDNVTGWDLTESAVNRVGQAAASGRIGIDHTEDGRWLRVWNYSVRVSQ